MTEEQEIKQLVKNVAKKLTYEEEGRGAMQDEQENQFKIMISDDEMSNQQKEGSEMSIEYTETEQEEEDDLAQSESDEEHLNDNVSGDRE